MSKELGAPLDELLSELVKIPSRSSAILSFMTKLAASGIDRTSVDNMLRAAAPQLGTTLADLQEEYVCAQARIGYWKRVSAREFEQEATNRSMILDGMRVADNEFTRLCREASELDCHDAAKLKAFIDKLASAKFEELGGRHFCADYVLKHVRIGNSPALTALLAEKHALEDKIWREKDRSKITLTRLRGMLSDARVFAKYAEVKQ
jgi:hypothetical protein